MNKIWEYTNLMLYKNYIHNWITVYVIKISHIKSSFAELAEKEYT